MLLEIPVLEVEGLCRSYSSSNIVSILKISTTITLILNKEEMCALSKTYNYSNVLITYHENSGLVHTRCSTMHSFSSGILKSPGSSVDI